MSTWINSVKEYEGLLEKHLERANAGNLSKKQVGEMMQMTGAYYEMFDKMKETIGERAHARITEMLLDIQNDIEKNDAAGIAVGKNSLSLFMQNEEAESRRLELIADIFKGDAMNMKLEDEKLALCMQLVDLDIKIYGKISEQTLDVIESMNIEVINGTAQRKQEQKEFVEQQAPANRDVMQEFKSFVSAHASDIESAKQEKQTLVVNAYAGPGAGKTTACLATVAALKKMGYVAEYVSEYAKELVYDNPQLLDGTVENQYSILQEQTHRLDRFMGKVDIIVTDAPILLNTVYGNELPPEYASYVKQLYDQYDNFNFFVNRGGDFQQEGRVQNKEESIQKDNEIKGLLKDNKLFFGIYNHKTVENLAKKIDTTYTRLFGEKEGKIIPQEEKKPNESTRKNAPAYKGSCYEKAEGKKKGKEVVVYGDSPEQILQKVRDYNKNRTEQMQLTACYVRKLNKELDRYENPAKYDVETGLDITPIYLNMPHLQRAEYLKLIEKLQADGAKYNPIQKRYYVTKQDDLNLFRDYLPIAGTQAELGENRSRNELPYDIEPGTDYYDNRVKITIKGMEPINIYGDSFDVHFPSLSAEETREIVEKFVLPGLDPVQSKPVQEQMEYNGRNYTRSQYDVIQKAISQHFTREQLQMLERPELTSDRLNEVRFAIKDGLSAEQIAQFATPEHEQWQMDLCRIGMQHGFSYNELKPVIDPKGYKKENWGERRNMLAKMLKEQKVAQRPSALKKLHENEIAVARRNAASKERDVPEKVRNAAVAEK